MAIHLSAGQQKEKTVQKHNCHFLAPVRYVTFPRVPYVTDKREHVSALISAAVFPPVWDGVLFV